MKRFFSVVGAFIIATGLSCAMFTGLGFADSVDLHTEGNEETDYEEIRTDAIATIEAYLEGLENGLDDDELKHKDTNSEEKAKVVAAYYLLTAEDQEPYTELIKRIKRDGVPQLEFIGATQYDSADDIDYYHAVKAVDEEDGEIELTADNTTYHLEPQHVVEGAAYQTYELSYQVTDSDGNTGELTQNIEIKTPTTPDDEKPEQKPGDNQGENPGEEKPGEEEPGEEKPPVQDPNQPGDGKGDQENPGDNKPGDEKPGDNTGDEPGDDEPGDNTGDDEPGDDEPGDDEPGQNPGDNNGDDNKQPSDDDPSDDDKRPSDDNQSDDNHQSDNDNQNTPTIPGSTNSNNSNGGSKYPTTLPNTGPSEFLSKIPTSVYLSVLIGLVVATTVFCLTNQRRCDTIEG